MGNACSKKAAAAATELPDGSTSDASSIKPRNINNVTNISAYASSEVKTVGGVRALRAHTPKIDDAKRGIVHAGDWKYNAMLRSLTGSVGKFIDKEFPSDMSSICDDTSHKMYKEYTDYVWLRPEDFYAEGGFKVFEGKIEPNDIRQGALGDCYFLATASSLAEWPERIVRLFLRQDTTELGCYCVLLCRRGEWKELILDDQFPCKDKKLGPCFTRGNGNELWVLLLEKAWAKAHGSYERIEAGTTSECLADFTGAPVKIAFTDDAGLWDDILRGEKENFIMNAGCSEGKAVEEIGGLGLVASHAYSLLAAVEVKTSRGKERLVKLRNPWGECEWLGDWSDKSPLWTPALKKQLKVEDTDDGIFYMAFDDFKKNFSDISICMYHDGFQHSSLQQTTRSQESNLFLAKVEKKSTYFFTVHQDTKRLFSRDSGFEYSWMSIVVGKEVKKEKDGSTFEYCASKMSSTREVWVEVKDMDPGNYFVHVFVQWHGKEEATFGLSGYGKAPVKFQKLDEGASEPTPNAFLRGVYIDHASKNAQLKSFADKGEANAHKAMNLLNDGFGYVYYKNDSVSPLKETVKFIVLQGMSLVAPHSGSIATVEVPPQSQEVILLKLSPTEEKHVKTSSETMFEKSAETLIEEVKKTGKPNRRRLKGEEVDILFYVHQHSGGVCYYYENNTPNMVLEEIVKFKLEGLVVVGDEGASEVQFTLAPGETHLVQLKRTGGKWSLGNGFSYKVHKK